MKKKEQKHEWDANTLCIPYISLHPSLHALCKTVGEGHGVIIGNTQSVSIPFLFLFRVLAARQTDFDLRPRKGDVGMVSMIY